MQTTHPPARSRRLITATALALLSLNPAWAQTTAPTTPDSENDKNQKTEEIVTLSPFVVDASKDQGYRATSTLAGSRINTDLKDVAQSITVVTKEFFNDVQAVGINDILTYTANTEGTRDFTSSQQSLGRPSDNVASNPFTANRVRGLQAADITRDYFYTIGTWAGFDTYNLDQVTINRGPNSILAGLGSPAGIINYSPQLANLYKSHNEVSFRFGSYGDKRATLNSNVVAQKNVLAFRVAGAWSDIGYRQQPAYNHDRRLYLAATYRPWKNTTIRASYETVKIKSENPNSLTPEDDVSQWVALGKPTYDSSSPAPVSPYLVTDGSNRPTVVYNSNGTIEGAYNVNTTKDFYQQNLTGAGIFTPIRMNSDKYFNIEDVNVSPSDQTLRYNAFNASLEQQILPSLNLYLAYMKEHVSNDFLNLFRTENGTYMIDVNKLLPDGSNNPHYGETYMQYRGLDNKLGDGNSNEVMSGTLTYDLDLTKINKWLGHYHVTGFLEKRTTNTDHLDYNAIDPSSSAEDIGYRFYLGGTAGNGYVAQSLPLEPGLVTGVTNTYYDSGSNSFMTNTLNSTYSLKSEQRQLVKLSTSAAVIQAYLWKDKLVGMFGIRRDENEAGFSTSSGGNGNSGVNPAPPVTGPLSVFKRQTKTYGAVFHALKWLSFHYNHSENFIPNAGAVDLLNNPTPSPTGTTKEYGFSISALDNHLNAKVNWFELTAAGASASNANFPLAQWTIPYLELTFMPDLARQAGITYKPLIASGLQTGDPRLANAYTSDNVSKGLELEVTYNVTKNWRLMASVSKQDAEQKNIASGLTAFIENRLAYWQSIPALWSGPYVGQNVGWGVGRTGQQQWNSDNAYYYLSYKAAEGQPSTQLAKWHASGLTNYTFSEGKLKGFSIGGGARYIEGQIIGNPAITTDGTVTGLDLAHPYKNSSYIAVDAWLGYETKIFAKKYDLRIQLNARDLQSNGGFRPIVANSDGAHAVYRIQQPRTFYLTTTLGF